MFGCKFIREKFGIARAQVHMQLGDKEEWVLILDPRVRDSDTLLKHIISLYFYNFHGSMLHSF